jgi:hypothetical protein
MKRSGACRTSLTVGWVAGASRIACGILLAQPASSDMTIAVTAARHETLHLAMV